uniref:Ribosomal protein L2 n=1 Tax=Plectus sambesii TaxID=2011161 RepID=A0A914W337_9BILA
MWPQSVIFASLGNRTRGAKTRGEYTAGSKRSTLRRNRLGYRVGRLPPRSVGRPHGSHRVRAPSRTVVAKDAFPREIQGKEESATRRPLIRQPTHLALYLGLGNAIAKDSTRQCYA